MFSIDLTDGCRTLPAGSLVEIEESSMLYLGEVQQWNGPIATILVEHSVDRTKLATVSEMWR
jgi:hypothetical protein